jgi:hypothetical protein
MIIKVVSSLAVQQEIGPRTVRDFPPWVEVEHAIHEGSLGPINNQQAASLKKSSSVERVPHNLASTGALLVVSKSLSDSARICLRRTTVEHIVIVGSARRDSELAASRCSDRHELTNAWSRGRLIALETQGTRGVHGENRRPS